MQTAEHTRIRRKFFVSTEFRRQGFESFDFLVSHAPGGIMRSGKPFAIVSSQGTLAFYTTQEAIYRVGLLKRAGWRDLRDPGYDTKR